MDFFFFGRMLNSDLNDKFTSSLRGVTPFAADQFNKSYCAPFIIWVLGGDWLGRP